MATQKFLDQNGLQTLWGKIKQHVADSSVKYAVTATYAASAGYAANAGSAVNATQADKTKASLHIIVKNADGSTGTYTFNGSSAATATVDMSALATDLELNAAVEALGAEIDDRIASVTADGTLITASTDTNKEVTVGPTTKLTTAVGLAEGAVRSVSKGSTNGYIVVNTGGTTANIKVADFSDYVTDGDLTTITNGLSASIATNAQEISSIKTAISGGTHFIGISTSQITDGGTQKPTIGGAQKNVNNGDIVIYGNKEFIWNGTAWEELGDTTAESDRITALEDWKPTITAAVSDAQTTANKAVTAAANAQTTANSGVSAANAAQTTANSAVTAAANAAAGVTANAGTIASVGKTATAAINAISSLSGTVDSLSGTVDTINSNYASKSVAVGSLSASVSSPSGVTAVSATGNITKWTITPKSVAGANLTTTSIEIESIPDSYINNLN